MKVAIDAGHGMSNATAGKYDTGAIGGSLNEADIALQWALTGKWVLEQNGIDVFLTRTSDSDANPVASRDNQASEAGCTHFISVHCNSSSEPNARGVETFYRDEQDKKLAQLCQLSLMSAVGSATLNRGAKEESKTARGRLAVMAFGPPACLVEIGFISNSNDRVYMTDRNVRIKFWQNVAVAFKKAAKK